MCLIQLTLFSVIYMISSVSFLKVGWFFFYSIFLYFYISIFLYFYIHTSLTFPLAKKLKLKKYIYM